MRCKRPHSSESHAPFTLIAGGSFWSSSHALPSTSTLAAVREVGTELHSNSNAAIIASLFIRNILPLFRAKVGSPGRWLDHLKLSVRKLQERGKTRAHILLPVSPADSSPSWRGDHVSTLTPFSSSI